MEQNKKEKLLFIKPTELRFRGPMVSVLTLTNPNNFEVIYKIKTTAPKYYGVRRSFGVLEPCSSREVQIALLPSIFESKERFVHKFIILGKIAPNNYGDPKKIWAESEEGKLFCDKFKCFVDIPRENQTLETELSPSGTSGENDIEASTISFIGDSSQSDNEDNDQENKNRTIKSNENFWKENTEALFAELRNENVTLREEISTLRFENFSLRNEMERLRDLMAQLPIEDPVEKKNGSGNRPLFYFATTVALAIVCTLVGKYFWIDQLNLESLKNLGFF